MTEEVFIEGLDDEDIQELQVAIKSSLLIIAALAQCDASEDEAVTSETVDRVGTLIAHHDKEELSQLVLILSYHVLTLLSARYGDATAVYAALRKDPAWVLAPEAGTWAEKEAGS